MANLKTDDPTSRRIVRAFLDFLDSVEPAPGVDIEGLEVAKDCLTEVFGLRQLPESERPEPNLLINLFSSQERSSQHEAKANHSEEARIKPSTQSYADGESSGASKLQDDHGVTENNNAGVSKDELFGHFFDALEKIHFFAATANGDDDHVLLDRATCLFHEAINEMERSGCKTFDRKSLADALKTLGNKAMQCTSYSDAVERYTCAIALCENNAVYFCNRAAAYTHLHKYNEAIKDCLKSIEIDPNYSKAYSRLGLAYYAQGKYSDAINKGFRKALELDPNNEAVKENIRVAEQKLKEEQDQRHQHQDSRRGSRSQAAPPPPPPPPFPSVSFDTSSFPANFASMFANMAGNDHNGAHSGGVNRGARSQSMSMPFDSTTIPGDIASMFMNMAGNPFPGRDSQGGPGEQNRERGPTHHPFTSASVPPFDASSIPNDLAGMFMNMASQGGSQGPNSQSQGQQPQGFDDPGIGIGANISFEFGEQTPEEVTRTLRSVMGMFSGGQGGDSQGNNGGNGRSPPR